MPKTRSLESLHAKGCWRVELLLGEHSRNISINYITMIAVQTATFTFILIKLVVYTALSLDVKKTFCISHFLI